MPSNPEAWSLPFRPQQWQIAPASSSAKWLLAAWQLPAAAADSGPCRSAGNTFVWAFRLRRCSKEGLPGSRHTECCRLQSWQLLSLSSDAGHVGKQPTAAKACPVTSLQQILKLQPVQAWLRCCDSTHFNGISMALMAVHLRPTQGLLCLQQAACLPHAQQNGRWLVQARGQENHRSLDHWYGNGKERVALHTAAEAAPMA